jgi:mannosyltransferase
MDAVALGRRADARFSSIVAGRTATAGLLGLLLGISLLLRTRVIGTSFWIDEGITVGISSHPFSDIPSLLRQDGSPPLYYLLLHGWMRLFGESEAATHTLSLLFALACIPAAFWAADSVFGRRAGWIAAALAALNPFLSVYAQETRMYTLLAFLSIVATAAFVHAFVLGRRRYVPVFAALLVLLLYTHNWALMFGLATTAALFVNLREDEDRRKRVRDALLAYGAAAALYAPWIPTLVFQIRHTGAPWSSPPSLGGLLAGPAALASSDGSAMALVLAGGTGIAAVFRGPHALVRRAVLAIIVVAVGTLLLAWLASEVSPAWANRYFAVLLGPLILLGAVGLAHGGRLAAVAFVLIAAFWLAYHVSDRKSNVKQVAAKAAPLLRPGDLVVSTHPEQTPTLYYYLPRGLRYATTLGPVADPRIMDWRDAVERLRASRPARTLEPLVARLPIGARLILVRPIIAGKWNATWTRLVRRRSWAWGRALKRDPRFLRLAIVRGSRETFKGVFAVVYLKVRAG